MIGKGTDRYQHLLSGIATQHCMPGDKEGSPAEASNDGSRAPGTLRSCAQTFGVSPMLHLVMVAPRHSVPATQAVVQRAHPRRPGRTSPRRSRLPLSPRRRQGAS